MMACERCSRAHQHVASHHLKPMQAVCLVGEPRSIGLTAPSLREFLLDSLDADGFVVAVTRNALQRRQAEEDLRSLGPRIKITLVGLPEDVLNVVALEQTVAARAQARGYVGHAEAGHGGWPRKHAEQWLTRQACANVVHAHEQKQGWGYRYFARVRLDAKLFAAVDKGIVNSLPPEGAVIPRGNEFGDDPYIDVDGARVLHVTDKMLFGGRKAFDADASVWRTMVEQSVRFYSTTTVVGRPG